MCLFGSSKNGFGFRDSDLDICMTLEGHENAEVRVMFGKGCGSLFLSMMNLFLILCIVLIKIYGIILCISLLAVFEM